MLKILGGSAKGRPLKSISDPGLRPILARIKKSLFDIITPRLAGARFLDLYAGTGAVGLEAVSRGASFVVMVEKDRRCGRVLKDNLTLLKFGDKARLVPLDVLRGLSGLPGPFDLIFMGPPYKDLKKNPLALVTPTLAEIEKGGLLAENGLIIAQHHEKEKVELPSENWTIARVEEYGDSRLTFVKPVKP